MKPQRKIAGGRKSEQHYYDPQPKPSSVQIAVGCSHQKSVSTATNERARIDYQLSPKSSSARNAQLSSSYLTRSWMNLVSCQHHALHDHGWVLYYVSIMPYTVMDGSYNMSASCLTRLWIGLLTCQHHALNGQG